MITQVLAIAQSLQSEGGFCCKYFLKNNPKMTKQLPYCLSHNIQFMVIFGQDELDNGTVKVKNLALESEEEVERSNLIAYLRENGVRPI